MVHLSSLVGDDFVSTFWALPVVAWQGFSSSVTAPDDAAEFEEEEAGRMRKLYVLNSG